MSVMKQSTKSQLLFQGKNTFHHLGCIPFMNNHYISAAELARQKFVQAEIIGVRPHIQLRECSLKIGPRLRSSVSGLFSKVPHGPAVALFIAAHRVSLVD